MEDIVDPVAQLAHDRIQEAGRLRVAMIHTFSGLCSHLNCFTGVLNQLEPDDVKPLAQMTDLLRDDLRRTMARLDELTGAVSLAADAAVGSVNHRESDKDSPVATLDSKDALSLYQARTGNALTEAN